MILSFFLKNCDVCSSVWHLTASWFPEENYLCWSYAFKPLLNQFYHWLVANKINHLHHNPLCKRQLSKPFHLIHFILLFHSSSVPMSACFYRSIIPEKKSLRWRIACRRFKRSSSEKGEREAEWSGGRGWTIMLLQWSSQQILLGSMELEGLFRVVLNRSKESEILHPALTSHWVQGCYHTKAASFNKDNFNREIQLWTVSRHILGSWGNERPGPEGNPWTAHHSVPYNVASKLPDFVTRGPVSPSSWFPCCGLMYSLGHCFCPVLWFFFFCCCYSRLQNVPAICKDKLEQ